MNPVLAATDVLRTGQNLAASRGAGSWARRHMKAAVVLLSGCAQALACGAIWLAAEIWTLMHLLLGIPLILACFAVLLGLWCLYLALRIVTTLFQGLYFRLLLGSAERL